MDYLPLFFDLRARLCLVVGGGTVAQRKVELLLDAQATIKLVAPEIEPSLKELLSSGNHQLVEREIEADDFQGVGFVISATNNRQVNAWVSNQAKALHTPVNVVDDLELTDVVFPAIVDRSPIIAAVATGGASPVLTRRIRTLLETLIPEKMKFAAQFLGDQRSDLKARVPDIEKRRRLTEAFLESPAYTDAEEQRFEQAKLGLDQMIDEQDGSSESQGEVYVVGAGPGDPDLLTLKALQLMQKADIVLYDSLVSPEILQRARRDATKLYVGKKGGGESTAQESINEMLVRLGKAGHRVCRLKGGDPFVFGRGGEEIESLIEENIPFQVVPGISAANGCAAYAGIPLTHRDYSQSVRFVTGHPKQGQVELAWQEFAHKNQTVVFYMGLGGLEKICQQLIQHGRDPNTPIAIVASGTLPEQKVVTGKLDTIIGRVTKAELKRPTLIIVGEVVAFREKIKQS